MSNEEKNQKLLINVKNLAYNSKIGNKFSFDENLIWNEIQ